jgi:hypothetical protein
MRLANRRAVLRFRQRAVSATLLAAYVVTAGGIPLPSGDSAQKSGGAYPCAGSACGCRSAEQCWRSCCCHTLAERFAWAREHNVRPPEYAIAKARDTGLDLAWLEDSPAPGCFEDSSDIHAKLCVLVEKPPAEPEAAGAHVSDQRRCCCCAERHQPAKSNSTSTTNRVVVWRALDCKGQSANWLAAVPTLIIANDVPLQELRLTEWLGPAFSERANNMCSRPAIPPPKTA